MWLTTSDGLQWQRQVAADQHRAQVKGKKDAKSAFGDSDRSAAVVRDLYQRLDARRNDGQLGRADYPLGLGAASVGRRCAVFPRPRRQKLRRHRESPRHQPTFAVADPVEHREAVGARAHAVESGGADVPRERPR
jgi:hypothetical protein